MPIYKITEDGKPDRLIDASSSNAAIRHAAQQRFKATTIKNPSDIARLMSAGVPLETAAQQEDNSDGD
jgi:hypothetical protein